MKLHILGTGNGAALNCYNTCFALENNGEYLLVDGGGGNQILKQLQNANIDVHKIHNIFLSHIHTDHIIGVIWVIRRICEKMIFKNSYIGNLNIYGGGESIKVLKSITEMLFPAIKRVENRVFFNIIEDKQTEKINGLDITFFNINARKEEQFGFIIGNKLAFCGDEPLNESLFDFVKNKEWLIHEGFCLDAEEEIRNCHAAGHCTILETSSIAQSVNAKNLIILHTEDDYLESRKKLFINEAKQVFEGNVFVPDDLEIIEI